MWYYRALVPVFLAAGPKRFAEELERMVSEIERLAVASPSGTSHE